jgi:purine catabolism regulator
VNPKPIETVEDLLQHAVFRDAELTAGHGGLHNRVRWIHILEVASATFANRHDFLLTTGLGLKELADKAAYIRQLAERGVAGMCIELGRSMPAVPPEMKAAADRAGFPIAVFRKEVRFVDITQQINALFINRQHQILVDLEAYARSLQQLSLETTDIDPILRRLHRQTCAQVLYFALTESPRVYPPLPTAERRKRLDQYKAALDRFSDAARQAALLTLDDTRAVLSQPVVCLGQTLAYVGLVLARGNTPDPYPLLLDYTGKTIAQVLLRKLFLEQKHREHQAQIIEELLQGSLTNEEEALSRSGLALPGKGKRVFVAAVFELEREASAGGEDGERPDDADREEAVRQDLFVLLRAVLQKNNVPSLQWMKNRRIYAVCAFTFPHADDFTLLKNVLSDVLAQWSGRIHAGLSEPLQIRAAFSRPRTKLTALAGGFRECADVLAVARFNSACSPFYQELGVERLLLALGVADPAAVDAFIDDHLGAVLEYDRRHRTQLTDTLAAYLACCGSVQETARRLFIHRQTLYHRLAKLEQLLGDGFMDPDKRLNLEVALYAHRFRRASGPRQHPSDQPV